MKKLYLFFVFIFFFSSICTIAADIKSSGAKGNWNSPGTWIGGVVPSANDNVIIANGDTVYYNLIGGTINNITIGENSTTIPTGLLFKNDGDYTLTVNGNILVNGDSANFTAQPNLTVVRNYIVTLKGNLISTGTIDFKTGTSPNNGFLKLILSGTSNTILKVKQFVITPATVNEFASIEVNKTGGAKVILQSDIGITNTSAAVVTLTSGLVQTGEYALNVYGTGSGSIAGGSQNSYIWGKLGRGWSSSSLVNNKLFPIGDSLKYRPVWLSNNTSPYHLSTVEVVGGNANTGTSVLNGGIDKVSAIRYYKVKSGLIPRTGTIYQQFTLTGAGIGYYYDDGVAAGNTNLRVAVSGLNTRQTWTAYGPTAHTTTLTQDPTQIISDAFSTLMDTGTVFYLALARVTGTTENTLQGASDLREISTSPVDFELSQNYPNPFNPVTNIKFSIPTDDFVSLVVYDITGRTVASIIDKKLKAGIYEIDFDASLLSSGMYFYRLQSSSYCSVKKMVLVK
jgi:hypothetical protein